MAFANFFQHSIYCCFWYFKCVHRRIDASTHRPIAEKADWPLAESNANNATKRLKRKQKNTRLSVNKKRRILKKLV